MLTQTLLQLKSIIEDMGGIAKFTIAIEDEETFYKIKESLAGVFTENDTVGEIEGFDGIKIWNEEI